MPQVNWAEKPVKDFSYINNQYVKDLAGKNKKFSLKTLLYSRIIRRKIQQKISKVTLPDYTTFTLYSILIGVAAGLAAVIFHNSIEFFNRLFFERTAEGLFFLGSAAVIIIPAIGMLIQAIMIKMAPEIAARKGVSDVIKSVALRGGYIPFRTTLFHFIAPVICIGSGGTLGPEGPAAQLGGGVASRFGSLFNMTDERRRIFTAAGSGAAIAAIFNTPLGGVFFALEIILLNDFHTPTFSALILASVSASAVSRILLGNESVFSFQIVSNINYSNLYLYALLGLFSGIISFLFIRYSDLIRRLIKKNILRVGVPQWLVMILTGLLVGICGYYYEEIYGIGYSAINKILAGSISWHIVLILLALKFILVPLVFYSGGFGGMFAPSLFMGACFGSLFAFLVNTIWGINVDPVIMILVGMGALLGGINTIPISAILIIFEMTQNYSFILPLMLAVIVSTMFVQISLRGSVHLKHLESEGIRITGGRESNLLKSITVSEVNLRKTDLISEDAPLPEVISSMIGSPNSSFFTINSDGEITGIITETDLRPIITEYENVKDVLVARDIANPQFITVKPDDDLDYVLSLFGKYNVDQLPVVDESQQNKFVGAISRQEVLSVYNRETLKANMANGFAKELKSISTSKKAKISSDYSVTELSVPQELIGKTLSQLKLRNNFGLEVLMIKRDSSFYSDDSEVRDRIIIPDATYKLKREDKLVIFGKNEKIDKFRETFED